MKIEEIGLGIIILIYVFSQAYLGYEFYKFKKQSKNEVKR